MRTHHHRSLTRLALRPKLQEQTLASEAYPTLILQPQQSLLSLGYYCVFSVQQSDWHPAGTQYMFRNSQRGKIAEVKQRSFLRATDPGPQAEGHWLASGRDTNGSICLMLAFTK